MFQRMIETIKYIFIDSKDWVRVCLHASKWHTAFNDDRDEEKFSIWYHLYENSRGIRRYEITYTGDFHGNTKPYRRDTFFLNNVRPWAKGIWVKGIDSYQTACQQMTMDKLAGK